MRLQFLCVIISLFALHAVADSHIPTVLKKFKTLSLVTIEEQSCKVNIPIQIGSGDIVTEPSWTNLEGRKGDRNKDGFANGSGYLTIPIVKSKTLITAFVFKGTIKNGYLDEGIFVYGDYSPSPTKTPDVGKLIYYNNVGDHYMISCAFSNGIPSGKLTVMENFAFDPANVRGYLTEDFMVSSGKHLYAVNNDTVVQEVSFDNDLIIAKQGIDNNEFKLKTDAYGKILTGSYNYFTKYNYKQIQFKSIYAGGELLGFYKSNDVSIVEHKIKYNRNADKSIKVVDGKIYSIFNGELGFICNYAINSIDGIYWSSAIHMIFNSYEEVNEKKGKYFVDLVWRYEGKGDRAPTYGSTYVSMYDKSFWNTMKFFAIDTNNNFVTIKTHENAIVVDKVLGTWNPQDTAAFKSMMNGVVQASDNTRNEKQLAVNKPIFEANYKCSAGDCANGNGVMENKTWVYDGTFKNYQLVKGVSKTKDGKYYAEGTYSGVGEKLVPKLSEGKQVIASENSKGVMEGKFEDNTLKTGDITLYNLDGSLNTRVKTLTGGYFADFKPNGHCVVRYPDGSIYDGVLENGNRTPSIADENGFVNCRICYKKGKYQGKIYDENAFFNDPYGSGPFCSQECLSLNSKKETETTRALLAWYVEQQNTEYICGWCSKKFKLKDGDSGNVGAGWVNYCSKKCYCEKNPSSCN